MDIKRCTDAAPLRELMNRDAGEYAYALGDLDAAWWDKCDFHGAFDGEKLLGFVLFFHGFEIPTLCIHGDTEAAAEILSSETVELPPEVFCLSPMRFREAIAEFYDTAHIYNLLRMTVSPETYQGEASGGWQPVRLYGNAAERLNALYAQAADPGESIMAFAAYQIDTGIFYGVEAQNGDLIAAAGTHVVSIQENIGVVGNVFTVPALRGRGLGGVTTAAVTQGLFDLGVNRVVL
ncbi:MAG TPA: hypothetical protein VJZ27_11685, partial [Aggregatilineales bacterium]|nr:hypothetical protein [Aggregatilineales bacterium]